MTVVKYWMNHEVNCLASKQVVVTLTGKGVGAKELDTLVMRIGKILDVR